MRTAHPGCGRPAGGRGYNSGGNYCGGWAGNCGDGGVGGSSWYLICEKCREAHQKQSVSVVEQGPADKAADPTKLRLNTNVQKSLSAMVRLRKKSSLMMPPSAKMISPSGGQLSSHRIMHNNAMFLLDLASSASNSNLVAAAAVRQSAPAAQQQPSHPPPPPPTTSVAIGGARSKIPPALPLPAAAGAPPPFVSQPLAAVSELAHLDPNPFPLVPFQCFAALGVQGHRNPELLTSSK